MQSLAGFELQEVLGQDARSKTVAILGRYKLRKQVLKLLSKAAIFSRSPGRPGSKTKKVKLSSDCQSSTSIWKSFSS